MLAVAGPVFEHPWFATLGFPAVVTAQAQRIAVADHQAFGVAEAAHGVAVAVDHRTQLAVFVVAVLSQRFDGLVVHHPLDVGQSAQRIVVVQVHAGAAGGADVGQRAVRGAGEMQEMAEGVLDALQRDVGVGVRHLAEVEEQVVEGLQEVMREMRTYCLSPPRRRSESCLRCLPRGRLNATPKRSQYLNPTHCAPRGLIGMQLRQEMLLQLKNAPF